MARINRWITEKKDNLSFAVILNIITLSLMLFVYYPQYETNDDMGIISLVSGLKGTHDYHLVYINSLIGRLLSIFYNIRQNMPWYAILQYIFLFVSLTAITYVLLHRLQRPEAIWFVLLFLLIFSYEGYIRVQYTKSAGIISAAGFALLFLALFEKKIPRITYLIGFLLALIGSMYRISQFFCEGALFSALGVYYIFQVKKLDPAKPLKRFGIGIGTFALLLVCVLGLYQADRMTYSSDYWQYYMRYNAARTELLDYGFPDYDANEEAYLELGIDRITNKLFHGWTHSDSEKITPEVMEGLIALKEPKQINRSLLESFWNKVPAGFPAITAFWFFSILGICWILRGKHTIPELLTILYEAFIVFLIYFALFYRGRVLLNRVDIGIWLAISLVVLWLFEPGKKIFSQKLLVLVFAGMLIYTQNTWQDHWRINKPNTAAKKQKERNVFETIHADMDHIYFTKTGTTSFARAYGVLDSIPFGIGTNMYPLGGWTAQSEPNRQILDRYHIRNPFRDMIDNPDVYVIDKDIDTTLEYLHIWYNPDAEATLVKKIGNYSIYQITTKK